MEEISSFYSIASYCLVDDDVFCSCVGIQECEASLIDDYHCPNCEQSHGQLQCKCHSYGQLHQGLLNKSRIWQLADCQLVD